jgi:CheY-like chemotaxis protein
MSVRVNEAFRVLVVDDEEDYRELLCQALINMGCEVAGAAGGKEALQEMVKKPFDLVFSDLNMRGMNGWRLARKIREFDCAVPIVLVTGAEKTDTLQKLQDSNVNEVVFKPFRLDDIREIIKKTFQFRMADTEHISLLTEG